MLERDFNALAPLNKPIGSIAIRGNTLRAPGLGNGFEETIGIISTQAPRSNDGKVNQQVKSLVGQAVKRLTGKSMRNEAYNGDGYMEVLEKRGINGGTAVCVGVVGASSSRGDIDKLGAYTKQKNTLMEFMKKLRLPLGSAILTPGLDGRLDLHLHGFHKGEADVKKVLEAGSNRLDVPGVSPEEKEKAMKLKELTILGPMGEDGGYVSVSLTRK